MKITVENLNGRLRLRWICPVSGNRKTLAVGMADSPAGRAYAHSIKDRIETDAHPQNLHEYYDPTLLKYRDKAIKTLTRAGFHVSNPSLVGGGQEPIDVEVN
jgi:hypothetical protein